MIIYAYLRMPLADTLGVNPVRATLRPVMDAFFCDTLLDYPSEGCAVFDAPPINRVFHHTPTPESISRIGRIASRTYPNR